MIIIYNRANDCHERMTKIKRRTFNKSKKGGLNNTKEEKKQKKEK